MKKCTLVIPRQWELVWLSRKKLKIGAGLYNGWGGKYEPKSDQTMLDTAIREFGQETGGFYPKKEALDLVAEIDFFEADKHIFECYVYFLSMEKGEQERLKDTPEMGRGEYFDKHCLPLDEMMPGDRLWLPLLLAGERISGRCYYKAGNKEVEKFEHEPLLAIV